MLAIYKRELKSLFVSFTAYIFIAFYFVVFGIYFIKYNFEYGYSYLGISLITCFWVYLLFAILPIHSFSEEKRLKIDQLLYTSPISVSKIVIGKYLAMSTVWLIVNLILCICPIIISSLGHHNYLADYLNIFIYFILGCAILSICVFISSLTESSTVSIILSMIIIFVIGFNDFYSKSFSDLPIFSLLSLIVVCIIIGLICFYFTKNKTISFIFASILIAFLLVLYYVNTNIFTGLFARISSIIGITTYFERLVGSFTFDYKIVVLYISITISFLYITIQNISIRRQL